MTAIAQRAFIHVRGQHAGPGTAHVEHHDQIVLLLAHRSLTGLWAWTGEASASSLSSARQVWDRDASSWMIGSLCSLPLRLAWRWRGLSVPWQIRRVSSHRAL